jgi:hypothetical protein
MYKMYASKNTNWIIRSRKSKKDRQYIGQKAQRVQTNNEDTVHRKLKIEQHEHRPVELRTSKLNQPMTDAS